MKDKIKTIEEIKSIIGDFSRKNTVVMCCGCWDIIHPGHLRHLEYAKQKADILICSVTQDRFITKGEDRPYVPENLRAKNLSFIDIVDYVFIDKNSTPIESIKYLQPNYYAKGFEYHDGVNPKTKEEIDTVGSYGGFCIYTPGDIIYSSTHLLSIHKPKLLIERLLTIMESENISFDDLLNTLYKFKDITVHVIGDTITDKYSYCTLLGSSSKTPTLSIKRESEKMFIGGAAIVAKHLQKLGANVEFTTILGNDNLQDYVINNLEGIKLNILSDNRPTTLKERFWCDGYKLFQVDIHDNRPISDKILDEIWKIIIKNDNNIVIFSDFGNGIFTKSTIPYLSSLIPKNSIKIADTKVNSCNRGNILDFKDFDIIFPNEYEARFAMSDQNTGIRPLGEQLQKKSKAKYVILKLRERGILTYLNRNKPKDFFALDSFVNNLVDATGAGDAMLAVTSLAYKVSNNIIISSILGNIGAAIECEKEGNIAITCNEIENKIKEIMELSK